jgi:hypothetical protein
MTPILWGVAALVSLVCVVAVVDSWVERHYTDATVWAALLVLIWGLVLLWASAP